MSSRDIWVGLAKHTLLDLERILLRPFTFDDVQDVYSYSSDEATTEFVFERHEDTSVTEEYITSNMREPLGRFAIEDKKTGHVIGQIALANIDFENNSAECSYTLHRGYWGQGMMSEAMKAVLNIAFAECKFESVFARVERENVRSKNILLRHGFREIGTVEYARISPNKKVWVDDVWYQLLNVAYKNELKNNS